jgi:hypothetical protein
MWVVRGNDNGNGLCREGGMRKTEQIMRKNMEKHGNEKQGMRMVVEHGKALD